MSVLFAKKEQQKMSALVAMLSEEAGEVGRYAGRVIANLMEIAEAEHLRARAEHERAIARDRSNVALRAITETLEGPTGGRR